MKVDRRNTPNCLNCPVHLCPIASSCSQEWQERSNKEKTVVFYKKGQLIVKEDTEAFGIYINYKGKVIITSERENERRQIIRIAKEGDILEFIQHDTYLEYPFSLEAIEDCICCYLPKDFLFQFLNNNAEVITIIEQRYADKLVDIEKRLKYALIMSVQAKLAYALLRIDELFKGRIPLLRKELGEMIGASAEQVSREIMKMASDGLVSVSKKNKEIKIVDKSGLQEIMNRYEPKHQIKD